MQIVENVGTRHIKGVAEYINKLDAEFRKIGFLKSILCNVKSIFYLNYAINKLIKKIINQNYKSQKMAWTKPIWPKISHLISFCASHFAKRIPYLNKTNKWWFLIKNDNLLLNIINNLVKKWRIEKMVHSARSWFV